MKNLIKLAVFMGIWLGLTVSSFADYRYYAWTYQFVTMQPGELELEFYTTMYQPKMDEPEGAILKKQIEIETGLTDRWDISLYFYDSYQASDGEKITVGEKDDEGLKFSEVKLRTRFKLVSEKGKFIVDPLLYLEYKFQTDRTYPDKWEIKLILAKDIGDLNIAVNIIPEETYKSGSKKKEWKTEYAVGISYPVVQDVVRVGIESKGDLTNEKYLAGPSISIHGSNVWTAISPIYGLNSKSDDLRLNVIVGLVF